MNTFINATFHSLKARICLAEWSKAPLPIPGVGGSNPASGFCDCGWTRAIEGHVLNENSWPKLQLDKVHLQRSVEKFPYFC